MKKRILCVCFGNTCRSPLMAAVLQSMLGEGWIVESAGVVEKVRSDHATNESILVADEHGIDIRSHRPRSIRDMDDLYAFDRYIVTDQDVGNRLAEANVQRNRIIVLNEAGGGILNPWERGIDEYRACMDQIQASAKDLALRLK